MSISITSYPVLTDAAGVQNALAGFDKIEIEFTRTGTEDGVEVVLVDPDDEAIDLLGFSLHADFSSEDTAIIDTSVIVGLTSQSPETESSEIIDSRIKYRIKYRPITDGVGAGSYTFASSEEPIIAIHSLDKANLNEWSNPITIPKLVVGYNILAGFINSDANNVGEDLKVKFDLLDYKKSVITSDNLLKDYGLTSYGLILANLSNAIDGTLPNIFGFNNAGYEDTTDWTNPTGGLAEGWVVNGDNVTTIVTGNGFSGNAQSVEKASDLVSLMIATEVIVSGRVKIGFKYRQDGVGADSLRMRPNPTSAIMFSYNANDGDALAVETDWFTPEDGKLQVEFYTVIINVGRKTQIDYVYYILEDEQPVVTPVYYVVTNGGGLDTTDWVNTGAGGTPDDWQVAFTGGSNIVSSIIQDPDFSGDAYKLEALAGNTLIRISSNILITLPTSVYDATLQFKCKLNLSAGASFSARYLNQTGSIVTISDSTSEVLEVSQDFTTDTTDIYLQFIINNPTAGDYFIIDEVNLYEQGTAPSPEPEPEETKFVNYKIISE